MWRDFIPESDIAAAQWMRAFAENIAAAPAEYQLCPADSSSISAAVQRYLEALRVARDPARRTMGTVIAKDDARSAAKHLCRMYAGLIKLNRGIDDASKIAVGVRPINPTKGKIRVPRSSPAVYCIAATPGQHTLRFNDSFGNSGPRGGKPFGATHLQLFRHIGDQRVRDPGLAQFFCAVTRNPIAVNFAQADAGKVATYFARWQSRRGETGPWSIPVSMHVVA
jgi:hypothetical protein